MHNPLLQTALLPLFDQIRAEHVTPAVDVLLSDANRAFDAVIADDFPSNWQEISLTLGVPQERLSVAWGAVSHLKSVMDTPELREAFNENLPRIMDFYHRLGSSEKLFVKHKAIALNSLNDEQQAALAHDLRDFVLGGAELNADDKARYLVIQERIAILQQQFSEHVLDATDGFSYLATEEELQGVPDDVLQAAKGLAEKHQQIGFRLTLQMPCYLPIMQYAKNRALRETLYRAYVTRASDVFDIHNTKAAELDNTPIIQEILRLRHEEAKILGFMHFASLSLATKMADSSETVVQFLRELNQKARPYALQDIETLRRFAKESLQLDDPALWDWTFISEQLKEARYAYSEHEVKQYFQLDRVLAGLFELTQSLFAINIVTDQAAVWHPDVRFFRIERQLNGQWQPISYFYVDPTARAGKRGGAWMDGVRSRWLRPDTHQLQLPVAHLVCNFAPGLNGKQPLLTHDDVITLFHEFGHGLHHMLTQVNEISVAGISGLEWDAVELPSQFMENFCWEWNVIQSISAHVDTGEQLPKSLFEKMLATKNYQSGMQTVRQIEFALFDMLLHSQLTTHEDFLQLLQQVRDEVAVIPTPAWSRTPHSFGHVFAGGYSAGYYSYKWAEVLSSDAYAAFEEAMLPEGRHNPAMGEHYCRNILEVGSKRPALESFMAFRGRKPSIDALLRHQGMTAA